MSPAEFFLETFGLVTALVIVPVTFLTTLANAREKNAFHWLLRAAYTGAFLAMMLVLAPWVWISAHLRWLWAGLYLVVLVASYRRHRDVPFRVQANLRTWTDGLLLLLFLGIGAYALTGYTVREEGVHLEFPLRDGTYVVGQGGNNPLVNYHNVHRSQKYALDIVAADAWGRRAAGLYPADLERYVIYDKPLYSPCDGRVTRAVDGFPDLIPPDSDSEHAAGNYVVIRCQGVNVVLGHMRQGSVTVREGETVTAGQLIGAVGNSGNTTEPHLHIHAVRTETEGSVSGVGVPIFFDGRFLVRNSAVRN